MNRKRYFTPAEANQTLPLVKRIVSDILETGRKIRTIMAYYQENATDQPEMEKLIQKLQNYFQELEELGCSYKDWSFGIGLVDFPAIIDNEHVLLCWRSDEESLQFYHGYQDGYAGRKPIPPKYLNDQSETGSIQ